MKATLNCRDAADGRLSSRRETGPDPANGSMLPFYSHLIRIALD
jgi:hypothetical protein